MPVLRDHAVGIMVWGLTGLIFGLDLLTPADDVSVCFAYLIPIFISLFEARPRPLLYASAATFLSIGGMVIQPPGQLSTVLMISIAIATQWVVATLVKLQQRRLVEANDRAELQRRFVDILSHEVGTALTTVNGQTYRLTKLSDQLSPADVRGRAEKIRRAAERIEGMISRIQFASSLGDGSIPTGEHSADLNQIILQLAEQMKEEESGDRIELQLSASPMSVAGDATLLRQILENVISNGLKYSPPHRPIQVSTSVDEPFVRVVVADQGEGLAQDQLQFIRDAYYRGPNSKGVRGTGLGLYIVNKLVEAHRGRMAIESQSSRGTKVTIDLPLAAAGGAV
jgi:signal transduction histidine kinase